MSGGMDRSCDTCALRQTCANAEPWGGCANHRYPEVGNSISFVDKIKDALPKEKKGFSLDKLIDDHWGYNEALLVHAIPDKATFTKEEMIQFGDFVYHSSGVHFWKHCCEHYRIEEKNDE